MLDALAVQTLRDYRRRDGLTSYVYDDNRQKDERYIKEAFAAVVKPAIVKVVEAFGDVAAQMDEAAAKLLASIGVTVDQAGGNCPVQIEGGVDGKRFYFRARGSGWELRVADSDDKIFEPTAYVIFSDYGPWPEAGWMPLHEAMMLTFGGVMAWRNREQRP